MTMMNGVSYLKQNRKQGFMSLLSSAACEWLLIFMLLLDATLSYLLTKFALYCKLQVPCPLCSRIDHVLEKKKPDYLRSLFCSNHREEISSLVCCYNHDKLADIRTMCEDCIVSSARSENPNSTSYRLLVGKLGLDLEDSSLKVQFLRKSLIPDYPVPRICSCCYSTLRVKSNTQRLLHLHSIGYGASKANVKPPLPRASSRTRFSRRENFKKLMNKFSGPVTSHTADPLSHVGYKELRITSDSESEVPLSDDDDTASCRGKNNLDMEFQQDFWKLPRVSNHESGPSKEIHQATFKPLPSLLDQPVQHISIEHNNSMNSSTHSTLHQVSEENQLHTITNPKISALPELISLDDFPQSVENTKPNASLAPPANLASLSELISLADILPQKNVVKISEKPPDIIGISHSSEVSISNNTKVIGIPNEVSSSVPSNITSDDQLAPRDNLKSASGIPAGILTTSNSQRIEEDIISSSAFPSSLTVDKSSKDTSTEMSSHPHDFQRSDSLAGSSAIDMMQVEAALEIHDSYPEPIDGITVKEIEGETVVDRFKRQIEYDQKCIRALVRELEEERSAAAVAANQAMAMITRLQEEKASLHMEALQYLRMMEEQAEYDMEALEKANDLLADKEKEIQELEAEYEIRKSNSLEDPVKDDLLEGTNDTKGDEERHQGPHVDQLSCTDLSEDTKLSESICTPEQADSLASKLEDEKLYVSQCLKKLELRFLNLSRNGPPTDLSNGGYSAKGVSADDNQEALPDKTTQSSHPIGENGLSMHRDSASSNGNLEKEKSGNSDEDNDFGCDESAYLDIHQHRLSSHEGELMLDFFGSQITNLQDRMKALEADSNMLIHALKTLQNGNDGLQFIQEIAHQLQELRNIEFKKRCLSIP